MLLKRKRPEQNISIRTLGNLISLFLLQAKEWVLGDKNFQTLSAPCLFWLFLLFRFMICCDHCEEWFHGICVGITMAQGRQMERNGQEYTCPKCRGKKDWYDEPTNPCALFFTTIELPNNYYLVYRIFVMFRFTFVALHNEDSGFWTCFVRK